MTKKILHQPLVFVDIETTGASYYSARVLEIAVIRVENNKIVDEFQTLLNPIGFVPEFITRLTGINTDDVHGAPKFADIAPRLTEIMEGAVFIAHNVRFDYSFIKREFTMLGQSFSPELLCTVRLSRSLFPQFPRHNLESLIQRHRLTVSARHRAYDDALCLWQFYRLCMAEFDLDTIEAAINSQFKRQSLPPHLSEDDIAALPEVPGVYIFEGDSPLPLYIGKSVNIRDRVLSHFNDDVRKSSELQISQSIRKIKTIPTTGELGALLLESKLIKELQPIHNKRLRRIGELISIEQATDSDGYFSVHLSRDGDESVQASLETLPLYETF